MEKELTLEERKQVQLDMLIEIDAFCREHNIKYALSCGTLIGAIRHKGFIPWDDDVDITMSMSDILTMRRIFTSKNMSFIDLSNNINYEFPFSRFAHNKTYAKLGKYNKDYGISIDVYPIIECKQSDEELNKLLKCAQPLFDRHLLFIKWASRLRRHTPFTKLPLFHKVMNDFANFMQNEFQQKGSGRFYQIGGYLNIFYKNVWDFNPLEELVDVSFEGHHFLAPKRYDDFLRVRYGDYMQLPSENQRHPYHSFHYYWK